MHDLRETGAPGLMLDAAAGGGVFSFGAEPAAERPFGKLRVSTLVQGSVPQGTAISVTRETLEIPNPSQVVSVGGEDSDAATVHLLASPATLMMEDGAQVHVPARAQMDTTMCDLRKPLSWRLTHPHDRIRFVIPGRALERWADDVGVRRFGGLRYSHGAVVQDDVIRRFAVALIPSLDNPAGTSSLFVDYALFAICTYIARTFGNIQPRDRARGGLAPWQERRAKELIDGNIDAGISLQQLADSCRLSVSYFAKAFRETTGLTPHQWLLDRRVERAMDLLSSEDRSLLDISRVCGFSDQSHFTKTFLKHVGVTPGKWRRTRGAVGHRVSVA